jgi:hypothetical protein
MNTSKLESFKTTLDGLKINPDIDHSFESWKTKISELDELINNYKAKITELQTKDIVTQNDINEVNDLKKKIEETIQIMSKTKTGDRGWTDIGATKTAEKINQLLQENTKMSKEAKAAIQEYYNQLTNGNPSKPLNEIYNECLKIVQEQRELNKTGKNWIDTLKSKAFYNNISQLVSMYFSIYQVINAMKEVVDTVIEIDTSLTELRKVSDATEQRLTQNFENSAKTAKELGSTISDVISATADWSRMGYDIDESEELARVSVLYTNVGDDIDIETANESLISTLQGFQLDAEDAESIIDKFNEVMLLPPNAVMC